MAVDEEAELERFTRRHLVEYRIQDELFWRPWLVPKMRIEGIERLEPGAGTIVAGVHVGPMAALQEALALRLAAAGRRFYISRWDKIESTRIATGARAHYVPVKVARLEAAGARYVGRGGSYALIRELLGRGETCWLAIDTIATGRGRVVTLAGRQGPARDRDRGARARDRGPDPARGRLPRPLAPGRVDPRADRPRRLCLRRGAPRPPDRGGERDDRAAPRADHARPRAGDGMGRLEGRGIGSCR